MVFVGAARANESNGNPTITVTIHNYAKAPSATLDVARTVATRILALAGVKAAWLECPVPGEGFEAPLAVVGPADGIDINLHIITRSMAAHLPSSQSTLGLAVLPGRNKYGDTAYVFYHRAEELAQAREASTGQILGHAMAHEVGHLLLNSPAHSRVGIMQAEWRGPLMELLGSGRLLFTSEQSRQIHAGISARQDAAKGLASSREGTWLVAANE